MTIDIKNLSASELFELAKQKEQEEQEALQRVSRLSEIKKQIAALISSHKEALAATDQAIAELQEKRTRLVSEFKAAITPLELDIKELERKVKADQAKAESSAPSVPPQSNVHAVKAETPTPTVQSEQAPTSTATPQPAAETPPAKPADSGEELLVKIRDIMRTRTYVSESLLKEKLKAGGFDIRNLKQDIEKLIREGKLEKKGIGNYALGKKK